MRDAVRRSAVIIILLAVSVLVGILIEFGIDRFDRHTYPRKYEGIVQKYAAEYSVPEEIVFSVIKTESGFDPNAVSSAGAKGLMQLLPVTMEWLAQYRGETCDLGMIHDPDTNIRYGTFYLSYLYERFGDWDTAFAAYNAGPGNVAEWLEDEAYAKDGKLTAIPYRETENYVRKIRAAMEKYTELYGEK